MKNLITLGLYLGVGALTHWMLIGDVFNAASVASWAAVLAWPLYALLAGTGIIVGGILVFLVIVWLGAFIITPIARWKSRRWRNKPVRYSVRD